MLIMCVFFSVGVCLRYHWRNNLATIALNILLDLHSTLVRTA